MHTMAARFTGHKMVFLQSHILENFRRYLNTDPIFVWSTFYTKLQVSVLLAENMIEIGWLLCE